MEKLLSLALLIAMPMVFPTAVFSRTSANKKQQLFIAGIFSRDDCHKCLQAANMALADVNSRNEILQGYHLNLKWNFSQCEPGSGAGMLHDLLHNPPLKLMVLCGCGKACSPLEEVAKKWNLVVVSFGSSSPAILNGERFPALFRAHPSATAQNPTAIKLFAKFNWRKISILHQAEEVFTAAADDLELHCKKAGVEIGTRQSFAINSTDAIRNLRSQDARIIVGLFNVSAARRVMCEAYKNNLYGHKYVWLLIESYENCWVNVHDSEITCTLDELKIVIEGHVTIEDSMLINHNQQTVSGMILADFLARLHAFDSNKPEDYRKAGRMYDTIWAAALALNETVLRLKKEGKSLDEFDYENEVIANEIYSAMTSTRFLGISGKVDFSETGDQIASTQVKQMIDGRYVQLGYYDARADNLIWHDLEKWKDGRPPRDQATKGSILPVFLTVSYHTFYLLSSLFHAFI